VCAKIMVQNPWLLFFLTFAKLDMIVPWYPVLMPKIDSKWWLIVSWSERNRVRKKRLMRQLWH
jgi:hypothetical protein